MAQSTSGPEAGPHADTPPPGGEDRAGGAAAADTPKPGFWSRVFGRADTGTPAATATPDGPISRNCVIVGPIASGKTLLLMSLDRCAAARSHSYADRYTATVVSENQDFQNLVDQLEGMFAKGLVGAASDILSKYLQPEFTLLIAARGTPRLNDTRFRTFDGPGGLLIDSYVARDEKAGEARKLLEQALGACDTVLLCLPICQRIPNDQAMALKQLLLHRRHFRRLVVCFTMYEALALQGGAGPGRHAYRDLAGREAARARMETALRYQLSALDNVLQQFQARGRDGQVWCVPVSSFGFIPGNGGANVDASGQVLRTRPAPRQARPAAIDPDCPYDYDTAFESWHPFLTLDPFIFIATGERSNTLIHSYGEIWNQPHG